MTLRLSTRISIRWADEPPSEPTTTVVMSVGDYFMDLRVNKSDGSVDWAFAGTREIVSPDPLHCRWHHIIDSRGVFDADEGQFQKLPNGDDLETGRMPCPERGNAVTPYEEVWRLLKPAAGLERGWILQRGDRDQGSEAIAFLGRVGGELFAMQQEAGSGSFSARRETLEIPEGGKDTTPRWVVKHQLGTATLPSLAATGSLEFPGETTWKVGDEVLVDGQPYVVRAQQSLASDE